MSQIYKLFYNNRMLVILENCENIDSQSTAKVHEYSNPSDLIITVRSFEKNPDLQTLFVAAGNRVEEVLAVVKSIYLYVAAAGGIVKNPNDELLFIHRFNKWDLPKGHVEEGEFIDKTAYREVVEETSVQGLVMDKYLGSTFHIYYLAYKWCIKETHYYLMLTNSTEPLIPQFSEAIIDAKWIGKSMIHTTLESSYASIKDFVSEKFNDIFSK